MTVGVVVALASAGYASAAMLSPHHQDTSARPERPAFRGSNMDAFSLTRSDLEPGQPCPDASPVSIAAAVARSDQPGWLPISAGPDNAFMCGGAPYFSFGSGAQAVFATMESGWTGFDPATGFKDLLGEGGSVSTLHGNPMLVQPALGADYSNEVIIVHGDEAVKILSASSVPMSKLTGIANAFAVPSQT